MMVKFSATLVLMNIAAATASVAVFAYTATTWGLASCTSRYYLIVDCAVPHAAFFSWLSHVILLLSTISALVYTSTALYRFSIAPFFLFMIATMIFCVGFDLVFQLPIKNFARLFGSTFNLSTAVIFLSFVFVILITPLDVRLWRQFLAAMVQSYLARDAAFLFYIGAQWSYAGMTSLYLMFVAFSFGAFTIHIMSIAGVLRRSRELFEKNAVAK
jgi:hypothetical protein